MYTVYFYCGALAACAAEVFLMQASVQPEYSLVVQMYFINVTRFIKTGLVHTK